MNIIHLQNTDCIHNGKAFHHLEKNKEKICENLNTH